MHGEFSGKNGRVLPLPLAPTAGAGETRSLSHDFSPRPSIEFTARGLLACRHSRAVGRFRPRGSGARQSRRKDQERASLGAKTGCAPVRAQRTGCGPVKVRGPSAGLEPGSRSNPGVRARTPAPPRQNGPGGVPDRIRSPRLAQPAPVSDKGRGSLQGTPPTRMPPGSRKGEHTAHAAHPIKGPLQRLMRNTGAHWRPSSEGGLRRQRRSRSPAVRHGAENSPRKEPHRGAKKTSRGKCRTPREENSPNTDPQRGAWGVLWQKRSSSSPALGSHGGRG